MEQRIRGAGRSLGACRALQEGASCKSEQMVFVRTGACSLQRRVPRAPSSLFSRKARFTRMQCISANGEGGLIPPPGRSMPPLTDSPLELPRGREGGRANGGLGAKRGCSPSAPPACAHLPLTCPLYVVGAPFLPRRHNISLPALPTKKTPVSAHLPAILGIPEGGR